MSQVNTELGIGSTTTISLNQTNVRNLAGVPSGTISMSNLQGKSAAFSFSFSGGTDVNLRAQAISAGWNQSSALTATNNGTIVSSTTGGYALTINGSFPAGVAFINNGLIVGRGGNGGLGSRIADLVANVQPAQSGSGGGPALIASSAVTITNNSTIAGGGGGGGGGESKAQRTNRVCGSSGGGGIGNGQGGAAATPVSGAGNNGNAGGSGSTTGAGAGGAQAQAPFNFAQGGAGGNGGGYATAGSIGGLATGTGTSYGGRGSGGAGGAAIVGNGNISWAAFGTRIGSIS